MNGGCFLISFSLTLHFHIPQYSSCSADSISLCRTVEVSNSEPVLLANRIFTTFRTANCDTIRTTIRAAFRISNAQSIRVANRVFAAFRAANYDIIRGSIFGAFEISNVESILGTFEAFRISKCDTECDNIISTHNSIIHAAIQCAKCDEIDGSNISNK